jgi:hypothetical protein
MGQTLLTLRQVAAPFDVSYSTATQWTIIHAASFDMVLKNQKGIPLRDALFHCQL